MIEYTKTTTEAASSGTTGRQGVVSCSNQILGISDVSITPNTNTVTQFNYSDTLYSSKTFSNTTGGTYTVWVRLPENVTVIATALTTTGQAYE
ncbi:MAG: hypothetical protein DRO96_03100 [Candidatus Aenigmatarchaeota archaeon]|nr:MAG: hypothetical protein DRO96_03100 [Candidatus Aenigmarchaeota archaeon]